MDVVRTPIGDITTTMLYIGGQACCMRADGRYQFSVSLTVQTLLLFLFGGLHVCAKVTTVPLLANLFIPSVLCLIGTVGAPAYTSHGPTIHCTDQR